MAYLKKLKVAILGCVFFVSCYGRLMGDGISSRLNVSTQDGTVTNWPYKLKVTNGSLTDNSDGTMSLTTGAGGGGGGGVSTLAITTGTLTTYANPAISSPTAVVTLLQSQFNETASGTTAYISINVSSITALGASPNLSNLSGTVTAGEFPALTGDVTTSAGSLATTAAGTQSNITTFTSNITMRSTFTVTGASVSINGVASAYPASACLQNQVLVSNGGTAPQLWSCQGQSGSGGGVVGYSGSGVSLTGTIYFPVVGGLAPSSTESAVDSPSPSGATIANFYAQLSQAVGVGNSVTFTWRKNGTNQSLTCSIAGANADSCSDTSDSFTVSQGDTVTIQAVPSGIIGVTPNVIMVTQFGTTGSNGTVNNGTANQMAYYAAGGTAVSGTSNLTSVGNSILVNSSTSFTQGIYMASTNTITGTAYTAVSTDTVIYCNATSNAETITLPSAANKGQIIKIFKTDTSANACTVVKAGTDLIASTGTWILNAQDQSIKLIADGTSAWWPDSWDATPPFSGSALWSGTQSVAVSSNINCGWFYNPSPVREIGCMFDVVTQNGNIDCAVIDQNCNRLASAGTTAMPAVGNASLTYTSAINIPPGYFAHCVQISNVTGAISGVTGAVGAGNPGIFANTATSMGIPALLTCPGTPQKNTFSLIGKVSGGITQ